MLEIDGLTVAYGGLARACARCRSVVGEGQFVAIVGPNGAGKTTLFKTISGTVTPLAGTIRFEGRDLLAVAPADRAHLGIAHVPEGRQVFPSLTVLENLEMGAYPAPARRHWARNLDRMFALFPVLAERRGQLAGTLVGRRAADAGDRPRHRLGAAPVDARRALDGAGAGDRRFDLRAHRGAAPRRRADRRCWSSSASPRHCNPATSAM